MRWWDKSFSDVGWQERRRRAEAADDLDKGDVTSAVQRLYALDEAQAGEIERLRLTVRVLTEILVDTMDLDEELLHQRMTEAMDEAKAAQAASDQQSGAGEVKARCTICSAPTKIASTNFPKFGLVCDACAALGKPLPKHDD